jgi:hypothetical protein
VPPEPARDDQRLANIAWLTTELMVAEAPKDEHDHPPMPGGFAERPAAGIKRHGIGVGHEIG